MLTRRKLLASGGALAVAAYAAPASAETWDEQWSRRLREDWPGWKRYETENAAVRQSNQPVDIVFLGDSITEGWKDKQPEFFSSGRLCRGVGGETTPQMLLRMIPDVCDLNPRTVHIMGGTNDIAGNTGQMTAKNTQDGLTAMFDIASAHGIAVIFASIPPAASFPWQPGLQTVPRITALNQWIQQFAREAGATYVDYYRELADENGGMKPGLASDGVHPTAAGYRQMAAILEPELNQVVSSKRRRITGR
jgi:lysophospholipase L1-like esterase